LGEEERTRDSWEPGCASAYGWAVESEYEDFFVVDH
jgi:hypothetical protein